MPDRRLRKLVGELARHSSEDIDSVLAELEAGPRARLAAMLAEQAERTAVPARGSKRQVHAEGPSLSLFAPWLEARIKAALEGRVEGQFNNVPFRLAAAAREALLLELASLPAPETSRGGIADSIGRLFGHFRKQMQ